MADDNVVDLDVEKKKRQLRDKLWALVEQGNLADVVRVAQEAIATNGGNSAAPPVALEDLIDAAVAQVERRASGEDKPVTTPWRHMNKTLGGGLWPGAHFLVAGTAVGKSQLSFQIARHAAKSGVPVGLIALELDPTQMVMRLAAEEANSRIVNPKDRIRWSALYNGEAHPMHYQLMKQATKDVRKMPIITDFGQAMGWPASRLSFVVKAMRDRYPDGPALLVLDFVQLVSSEEGADNKRPMDLRERIGRAGYMARNLGREYGVSIIIVSSTARENYERLSGPLSKLGLHVDNGRRICTMPDKLIGLGKESGELEYAADSVNVLLQPTITLGACHPEIEAIKSEERGKVVVCASVKVRAGQPAWFALKFVEGSFGEIGEESMNSLCGSSDNEGKAGRPKRDPQSYVLDVVQAVQRAESNGKPLTNATSVTEVVMGNDRHVRDAVKLALNEGFIFKIEKELLFKKMPPVQVAEEEEFKSEEF